MKLPYHPSGEVGPFEVHMLQNSFNATESSNDIHPVIVQLPEFAVMSLGSPPEWIANNYTVSHNGVEKETTNTHYLLDLRE